MTILELAISGSVTAVRSIAIQAAIAFGIAVVALLVVHAVDAGYTPAAFLEGLNRYNDSYINGDVGLVWNDSLPGAVKSVWRISGRNTSDLVGVAVATTLLGAGAFMGIIVAIAAGRVTLIEAGFLVLALSALFTPVYGEYHALVFAAPLMMAAQGQTADAKIFDGRAVLVAAAVLIGLSCVVWLRPGILTAGLLILAAILVPVLDQLRRFRAESRERGEALVLATSLLVLCPLGGGLTNGIAVSTLLLTAFVLICCEACLRGADTIDETRAPLQTAVYNGDLLL